MADRTDPPVSEEMFPLVFTSSEAAKVWGVHRSTVVEWVKSGHCTAIRRLPGAGGYLFSAEEVSRVAKKPRPKPEGFQFRRITQQWRSLLMTISGTRNFPSSKL